MDGCNVPERCETEWELLCSLYVLAEKLQDLAAKTATTDAMVEKKVRMAKIIGIFKDLEKCLPGARAIEIMYENSPDHCPGREVLIHLFVKYDVGEGINMMEAGPDLPKAFLWDLLYCMANCRSSPAGYESRYAYLKDNLLVPNRYHEEEGKKWVPWYSWRWN
jgi:hypothetical protein